MTQKWYVIHAYSGFENQVMRTLQERIDDKGLNDMFAEILVPTEEVVEMRDGKKRKSDRKFFPGYVLVKMEMNEDTWHLVKEAPKVLGLRVGGITQRSELRPSQQIWCQTAQVWLDQIDNLQKMDKQ